MRLLPDLVLTRRRLRSRGARSTIADGRIAAVAPRPARPGRRRRRLPGKALLPGTVNAHCHTFQSLLRGLGDDLDFMGWRDRVLYPFSSGSTARASTLGAAFAFAEMLLHGATTCVDFFYLQDEGNDNAEAVIQAAREVGIRLVLARDHVRLGRARPRAIARRRPTPRAASRELIGAHRRRRRPSPSSRRRTARTAPRRR